MKDLELSPKTGNNYGQGNLDLVFQEGHLMEVENNDVIKQAITKMTIASTHTDGYGMAIRELRGTKELVILRSMLLVRLMRGLYLISQWYNVPIRLKNVTSSVYEGEMKIDIEVKIQNQSVSVNV
jgi:hypothetical protein